MRTTTLARAWMTFFVILGAVSVVGGTIFFKNGAKISDVEIVNIQSGRMTIEKDGAKKTVPLEVVESYYDTDLDSDSGEIPQDYADYTVSVHDVDMPEAGEDLEGNTYSCEVKYRINRKGGVGKKAPFPYFYLYVLTTGHSGGDRAGKEIYRYYHGDRSIYRYYYPSEAKLKSDSYNRAAILNKLSKMGRPMTHFGQGRGLKGNISLSGKTIKFPLKKIDKRKILAYHLEVWGKDDLIVEKNHKEIGVKVGDKWWERY